MKGTVERAEMAGDPGRIRGDDGRSYVFRQLQVRNAARLQPGMRVDFFALGEDARDIHIEAPPPPPAARPAPETGILAPLTGKPAGNPWIYFVETLTVNYTRFTGRARRAEYWSYTLFWWLVTIAVLFLDGVMIALTSTSSPNASMVWFFYFSILWQLGTLLPNIAIVIRRLHDLDMSGWMYLIKAIDFVFFPFLGSIVLSILMLMDSKTEPNAHGPSPKYDQGRDVASVFS